MEELFLFYKQRITLFGNKVQQLKKTIHLVGTLRLALVVAALVSLWLARDKDVWMLLGIACIYFIPFVALIVYHNKLFHQKEYAQTMVRYNEQELNGLHYDHSAFDGGAEWINPEHPFSLDLDLFGQRSIFQLLNRTVTHAGKKILAEWLIRPLSDRAHILQRQQATRELARMTEWRQHFLVTGLVSQDQTDASRLLDALSTTPDRFAGNAVWQLMQWAVPAGWIAAIGGVAAGWIDSMWLMWLFFGCLVIAYSRLKQVMSLHNAIDKTEKALTTTAVLLKTIETIPFQCEELRHTASRILRPGQKASAIIDQLSGHLDALDQRYNWLFGALLNAFLLWDIRQCIRIEQWKKAHLVQAYEWVDALAHFDALCSLGSFAFNHPGYTYPHIAEKYFCMQGRGLGHPLMPREQCVKNDIDIEKSPWFLIITGANMAGKSTYLRTVGVNFLLSCIGVPVCADSLTLYPATLVTSLRTADSLADNESYFFAELKRLKMIIDRLQAGQQLFIILDEILKGTNSVDKQKGSLALMKQLIHWQTCGIIATHDLVLGQLEAEFPQQIKNYRFEADITEDQLSFSYLLREGIAQNMNACFLMKKMGITV